MRSLLIAAALGALVCAAGTQPHTADSAGSRVVVKNVVGMRLDRATRTLRNSGLRVNEECSGLFGCVIKSRWVACTQDPAPGTRLPRYSVVVVYAERPGEC